MHNKLNHCEILFIVLVLSALTGCSDPRQPPPTLTIGVEGSYYIIDHRRCDLHELTDYLTELAERSRLEATGASRWRVHIIGSSADRRAKAAGTAAMQAGFPQIYYHVPRQ